MIRDQKRNKRIYKGLLEDLIYYLKKIDSNEFDLFGKSNEFEKYYPILTELNLNFIFSVESRNLNTNMNAYDLTTIKKIFSVFIKNIEYDNDNNKVIINVVPQYEYIFEKLKNEDLTGVDIFSKIKEITSTLKIEKETLPRYFYKWFILVYRNRNSFDTSRIYKSRAYIMNPISNSSFIINVEIDNKIYSFEPGDFKIDINSNMNVVEIKPENLFTSRKYDIERFSTQGTLNESETSKYNALLKIQKFHLTSDVFPKHRRSATAARGAGKRRTPASGAPCGGMGRPRCGDASGLEKRGPRPRRPAPQRAGGQYPRARRARQMDLRHLRRVADSGPGHPRSPRHRVRRAGSAGARAYGSALDLCSRQDARARGPR